MPRMPAASSTLNARYGLHAGSGERYSMRVALGLPRLATGTRISPLRLLRAQLTCTGASKPGHQPLVAVDRLVRDRGDLGGVAQQAGHELLGERRQVVAVVGREERVLVAVEQRQVHVHAAALHALERLGHERGVHALAGGDLLDDQPERHDAVGHRQRVGVPQVDLVLARGVLVEAVLDRDAHRLERADGLLAQRAGDVGRGQVEEAALVERHRRLALLRRREVEELDVGSDEERVARARAPPAGCVAAPGAGRPRTRVPSRLWMSQNTRASVACSLGSPHGSTSNVLASGMASTSLSWMRPKPSIDEPSNVIPSSSAFSSSAGLMAKLFRLPSTSVNHSRISRTPRSSTVCST